jgi:hypothetical protein
MSPRIDWSGMKITLGQLYEFKERVTKNEISIRDWKIAVREFGIKHGLVDRDAVDIAQALPLLDSLYSG